MMKSWSLLKIFNFRIETFINRLLVTSKYKKKNRLFDIQIWIISIKNYFRLIKNHFLNPDNYKDMNWIIYEILLL
jgi:hypothetical protein